jgi:anti-sigma regulatory factor (Ser/Thr protein kinase)
LPLLFLFVPLAIQQGRRVTNELRWRRVFAGREAELSQLRRWLGGLLPAAPARDDVVIVAVELATNALKHTASGRGGWFAVGVTRYGPVVRVAVADGGASSEPQMIDDLASEHVRSRAQAAWASSLVAA